MTRGGVAEVRVERQVLRKFAVVIEKGPHNYSAYVPKQSNFTSKA